MLARTLAEVWLLFGPPIQRPRDAVPLRWEAPLECPDEAALRERVDRLVPELLDHEDAASSSVDVRVEGDAESYEATVLVRQAEGEVRRVFSTTDCEVLVDATALVIALAIDPVAVSVGLRGAGGDPPELEADEPEPEPEVVEPEPEVVESEPEPEPEPSPALVLETSSNPEPEPRRLGVGLRAFGGGSYGPTNTGYGVIGGAISLLGDRWRAELGGLWSVPRVVRVEGGIGGTFDGWAIFGRGCFAPRIRRLELPLCGAVEVGQVRGRGLDELPSADRASFVWIAPGLTQALWFSPIDRLGLGVELDVMVPLNRGSFLIDSTEVQRVAPVTVRGLAGVEVRW